MAWIGFLSISGGGGSQAGWCSLFPDKQSCESHQLYSGHTRNTGRQTWELSGQPVTFKSASTHQLSCVCACPVLWVGHDTQPGQVAALVTHCGKKSDDNQGIPGIQTTKNQGEMCLRKQEVRCFGNGFWGRGQQSWVWDQTPALGSTGTSIAGLCESSRWFSIPSPSCFSSHSREKWWVTHVLPKIYNLTFLVLEPILPCTNHLNSSVSSEFWDLRFPFRGPAVSALLPKCSSINASGSEPSPDFKFKRPFLNVLFMTGLQWDWDAPSRMWLHLSKDKLEECSQIYWDFLSRIPTKYTSKTPK